ncbi:hypothetical protein KSP40_PGU016594 [Platanthera guangdongensis]|uniref:Uncharacterized protein n=1 Tax=Platanthera guangdongensis TaxID=2320717 RepID=A0ABR2LHP4_9ASPA
MEWKKWLGDSLCATTADAVAGHCAVNIHQITWECMSRGLVLHDDVPWPNPFPASELPDGQGSYTKVAAVVDGISRLNVDDGDVPVANSISRESVANVFECKCGMPLCICKPPTPDPVVSEVDNYIDFGLIMNLVV